MKKHLLTFMFLTLFSSSVLFAQSVEIYTYDILPPFAFKDDSGKLTGIYIEITRKAIERMPDIRLRLKWFHGPVIYS